MKKNIYLITASFFLLAFIVFTVIVKTVDVTFVVTNETYIGLSHFNYDVGNWVISLGKMKDMKVISDILLYLILGYSFVFFVVGVIQWIKGKTLKAVDKTIYLLGACYVLIGLLYLVFELVKVNFSPLSDNGLKASYPSTHVFVGSTLVLINSFAAIKMLKIDAKLFRVIIYTSSLIICVLLAFTRLLSLKHWCTDIIASFLLIPAIYFLYLHFYKYLHSEA